MWKLVSASSSTGSGIRNDIPYGPDPRGSLIYTPDGRMAVMVSYGGREQLSSSDRVAAPAAERAAAFASFFAYSGRYTISGSEVIHHVEIASVENWVNTDQRRFVKHSGQRLTLVTAPRLVNGREETFELIWERVD